MFLFLSKLLPLFIYPLGLTSILLIVALVLWFKRSRWTPLPIFLALVILLTASNARVATHLVKSLEWQYLPQEQLPNAEAIVVLGGATKNPVKPRPMVDLNEQGDRLIYAAKLYQDGLAPLIILSGGRIEWTGNGNSEAADMAEILKIAAIPPEAMILEPNSFNTYQNATNVKEILLTRGIKKVLLVTSAMHMPRSLAIFQHLGIDAIAAPTDFLVSEQEVKKSNYTLEAKILDLLPDTRYLDQTTKTIKEYLGIWIYGLRGWL